MITRKRIGLLFATAALGSVAIVPTAAVASDTGSKGAGSVSVKEFGCNHTTATPEISLGSQGKAVKQAQCLLKYWGFSVGPSGVDGDFGKDTRSAVIKFQKKYCDLEPDGIVGKNTWRALKTSGC